MVSAEERARAHRAVGNELLARCHAVLGRVGAQSEAKDRTANPIPLHLANTVNDCRVRWYMGVLDPVLRGVIEISELDYSDPKAVGSHLRDEVAGFLDAAERAEDLLAFLLEFDQEVSAAGLLASQLRGHIEFGCLLILEVTAADDAEHAALAARAEEAAAPLVEAAERQAQLVDNPPPPPPRDELLTTIVGEKPTWQGRHYGELLNAFGDDVRHHAALASRQLRLLVEAHEIVGAAATTSLTLACRIGSEAFPLLAHRTCLLTWRLLNDAFAADAAAAASLLAGFYVTQASRIVAAGTRGDAQLQQFRTGDDESLIEAYRTLAEGILRPVGALVVHLNAASRNAPVPHLGVRPLLSELEDALAATHSELADLLTFGIARPLRNAGAHLDIVRSGGGRLSIAQEDGTLTPVDLRTLDRDYSVMCSALTGIDIACGIAWWRLVPEDRRAVASPDTTTDAVLEQFATFAAAEVVRGFVTDLVADGETLSFTLHGSKSPTEARAIVALLEPHIHEETRQIVVIDPEERVVLKYRLNR